MKEGDIMVIYSKSLIFDLEEIKEYYASLIVCFSLTVNSERRKSDFYAVNAGTVLEAKR